MPIALVMMAAMAAAPPPIPAPPPMPAAVQVTEQRGAYVMRSADSKPLYTFDRDSGGTSSCVERCATAWPPLAAPADAKPVGEWTIVPRADGSSQWAFRGKPVYSFARDANGVPSGDGMGGVWHLVPTTPAK